MSKEKETEWFTRFWDSPNHAVFPRKAISIITDRSMATLAQDASKKVGIPYRKVMGKAMYKKQDVLDFIGDDLK